MLDWTEKFLPGANTLAYLASSLAMKEKSFITLTPGQFKKTFLHVADDGEINKLDCFCSLESHFQSSLG